ncbi:hypothetical protein P691DRAFT_553348 [Macrolepiota fuliginosa MF-IS2]|uniref:Uncharacterized protein n=1 Tax=Macrolepiota fuliginosa MF-IS2 TaxID=1400762 RepID=A0A9P5WZT1_9AGAR|nr:hypothetical protein P691DRAFT_553348 [Macrolepiota fuliginosa MF-IS2]
MLAFIEARSLGRCILFSQSSTTRIPCSMDVPPVKLYLIMPISTTVLTSVLGFLIAAMFSGGLITLGITCIFLLSSEGVGVVSGRRFWQAYIIVLLLTNIGYQAVYFLEKTYNVMYRLDPKKQQVLRTLTIIGEVGPVLIGSMTDGVFVSVHYIL